MRATLGTTGFVRISVEIRAGFHLPTGFCTRATVRTSVAAIETVEVHEVYIDPLCGLTTEPFGETRT
jgi:hypothetical protein